MKVAYEASEEKGPIPQSVETTGKPTRKNKI